MNCPYCGGALAGGEPHCPRCGHPLQWTQTMQQPAPAQEQPTAQQAVVQVQMGAAAPAVPTTPASAIVALVLGIMAIGISFVPCVGILAIVPAIIGVFFGLFGIMMALKNKSGMGAALAGIILSVLSVIWVPLCIFLILGGSLGVIGSILPDIKDWVPPSPNSRGVQPAPGPVIPTPSTTEAGDKIRSKIGTLNPSRGPDPSLWNDILEVRKEIDRLDPGSERESLHERLDSTITEALEVESRKYLEDAKRQFGEQRLGMARRSSQKAIDAMHDPTAPPLRGPTGSSSAITEETNDLLDDINLAENPAARFAVTGITTMGGRNGAQIRDTKTGRSHIVGEGEQIDRFVVEAVEQVGRNVKVTLKDDQRSYELWKR